MDLNPFNQPNPPNVNIPTKLRLPPIHNNHTYMNQKQYCTNSSNSPILNDISIDTVSSITNNSILTMHSSSESSDINISDNSMQSFKLNKAEQEIQNGIKQFIKSDMSNIKQRTTNNRNFDFTTMRKKTKNCYAHKQYKLSVKKINKSLHSLCKDIKKQNRTLSKSNDITNVSIIDGPLNGNDYTKLLKHSTPTNLKMIRDTRNNRYIQRTLTQITRMKDCNVGDKVVILNNLHRENQHITQFETGTVQVQGVINKICSNYMTVIVPINIQKKDFIQRKIYLFDIKNKKYGAVYLSPN